MGVVYLQKQEEPELSQVLKSGTTVTCHCELPYVNAEH